MFHLKKRDDCFSPFSHKGLIKEKKRNIIEFFLSETLLFIAFSFAFNRCLLHLGIDKESKGCSRTTSTNSNHTVSKCVSII